MLYIFQKFCCLKKTTKDILFPQKCFLFAGYSAITCNIWKHLCWTHFYNLVASFRKVQQQKSFVMLSRYWPIRGCRGGVLSEYIKIRDKNVAASYLINF